MVVHAEFESIINQESLGQSTVNHTDPARSYAEGIAYFRAIALVVVREIELPGAALRSITSKASQMMDRNTVADGD